MAWTMPPHQKKVIKTQMKRVQEGKLKRKNVIVVPFVACVTIYSQNSCFKETRVVLQDRTNKA
jgi:hypothetical protein